MLDFSVRETLHHYILIVTDSFSQPRNVMCFSQERKKRHPKEVMDGVCIVWMRRGSVVKNLNDILHVCQWESHLELHFQIW